MVGHTDYDAGSSRGQEILVTGHARPEPAPHIEPLSGTMESHCVGCLLENRHSVEVADPGALSWQQTAGLRGRIEVLANRRLVLPADSSPRAPPYA